MHGNKFCAEETIDLKLPSNFSYYALSCGRSIDPMQYRFRSRAFVDDGVQRTPQREKKGAVCLKIAARKEREKVVSVFQHGFYRLPVVV
jgi:outer membrane lipopolysaccharide assembly protein LptE/RlpB